MQGFLNEKNYSKLYYTKKPIQKENSIQCDVSIPASIVDFNESIFDSVCKKWFNFKYAGQITFKYQLCII